MSNDLQWLLLRGGNSFMFKTPNGIFSREPGNLLNKHSYKYSGLANAKTVHVEETASGVQISTRKPSAGSHTVKKGFTSTSVRRGSGSRRAHGVATAFAKRGYRPDLRPVILARVSALAATHKEHKEFPEKKNRGKKALKAAE